MKIDEKMALRLFNRGFALTTNLDSYDNMKLYEHAVKQHALLQEMEKLYQEFVDIMHEAGLFVFGDKVTYLDFRAYNGDEVVELLDEDKVIEVPVSGVTRCCDGE